MSPSERDLSVPVSRMSCASCVAHVEKALKELPGVSNVVVSLATNKASFRYNPQLANVAEVKQAIENIGYLVPTTELTLEVNGMSCASCVTHVENALKGLPGVENAVVNLGSTTARVTYIAGVVTPLEMKRAVSDAGYEAKERVGSSQVDSLDHERNCCEELGNASVLRLFWRKLRLRKY
jgi:Cu+-exporting ATPase